MPIHRVSSLHHHAITFLHCRDLRLTQNKTALQEGPANSAVLQKSCSIVFRHKIQCFNHQNTKSCPNALLFIWGVSYVYCKSCVHLTCFEPLQIFVRIWKERPSRKLGPRSRGAGQASAPRRGMGSTGCLCLSDLAQF